jgi:F-type H+-transporting ATPase subunit b
MLDPNLTTVVFQIVNFLVLAGLLYLLFFKPVMRKVRARVAEKERLMAKLVEDQAQAARLRAELQRRMADLDEETAQIISEAREQAETERVAVLRQAQQEVEHLLVEAQMDAFRVRQQAVDEFHDQFLDAILEISAQVVGRVAPADLHEAMVKQLTDRIRDMGRHESARVEALRRSLGERTPTVTISSARPLSPELQELLVRTFSALTDRTPRLEVRTDPSLALGMRVRVGDMMVDNSMAGQLAGLRESVSQSLKERLADE